MTNETKKILDNRIDLTATCVRLPISVSHSESVNIQFEKPFSLEKVREVLDNFEGCKVIDDRSDGGYSTPLEAEGRDETFISRIREDKSIKNGLNLIVIFPYLLISGQMWFAGKCEPDFFYGQVSFFGKKDIPHMQLKMRLVKKP